MPGFGLTEREAFAKLHPPDPNPDLTFARTGAALRRFLGPRDPVAFLARTGLHFLVSSSKNGEADLNPFEQADIELLQSIALGMPRGPRVPTSPKNMVRGWSLAQKNLRSFPVDRDSDVGGDPEAALSRQVRIQTLYYRNIFSGEDAKAVAPVLLSRMDRVSEELLGYRLSDLIRTLFRVPDFVSARIDTYRDFIRPCLEGRFDPSAIAPILDRSDMARRAWRFAEKRVTDSRQRGHAAFQLSELGWAPVFTFSRPDLETWFGSPIANVLFDLSLSFGDLANEDPLRLYLNSPIRERPFIRLDDDTLFLPIPTIVFSFPFAIIEALIKGQPRLETAYSDARTSYLETATEEIIQGALPSAKVYQSVHWDDPGSGGHYENDLIAILGNHVFLFEAKSGKLNPASRRGGASSLRKNFKRLFVEPGQQAARLESLLQRGREAEGLLTDSRRKPIPIDLSHPVVVHSFGICIEHLASITSNRRQFEAIGLLQPSDPWSPIFSIGELRMLFAHLDTEVSFFHYLTRRTSIERILNFHGDEQDLLSVYLTNGFQFDSEAIKGTRVVFNNADKPVRGPKEPRADRREFVTPGIQLPPSWRRVAAELYRSDNRHRFDMIETILNLHPGTLLQFEHRARRWNGGAGRAQQGMSFARIDIADRTYAIGLLLEPPSLLTGAEWRLKSREVAKVVYEMTEATDCVVMLRMRKSKAAFDAISFFRARKLSTAERLIHGLPPPKGADIGPS